MSDNEAKGKARGGPSWNDHELLVYVLSAIEATGNKVDYANAPAPVGRNASGCMQKMNKVKIAYRAEIDAIKNGEALPDTAATPKKAAAGRKRKANDDTNGEETPKKRGRAKKNAVAEEVSEPHVKDEPEGEAEGEGNVEDEI